jgi:hypothetical protein
MDRDQVVDPLFLRVYEKAQLIQERHQEILQEVVRQFLGLAPDQEIDWTAVPPVDVIRQRMSESIPPDEHLSDLVVAMREE